MKKFLHFFLTLVIVSGAYAHEVKIFGGGNFSRYIISPETYQGYVDAWPFPIPANCVYEESYKTGVLAGVGVEFPLTRILSLEIDGFYSRKGSHFTLFGFATDTYGVYSKKINYFLDTLSFPVLLKIKFLRRSSPYIFGGVEPSFMILHNYRESVGWYVVQPEETDWGYRLSLTEITKSVDYGSVIGGGFELKGEKASVFIEVRAHFGMDNIITSEHNYIQSIKTNDIAVLFGFKSSRLF
jgi:hypothetical protein